MAGLSFGFELKRVTKVPDSRQDPGKSGDSAMEDIVPNFGRDRGDTHPGHMHIQDILNPPLRQSLYIALDVLKLTP